jgi:hypothetical protein
MTNTLLSVSLASGYIGWAIGKSIPFFPAWIGAISLAIVTGYFGTFRNGRGDFIRFCGYSLNNFLSDLSAASKDVKLKENTWIVLENFFSFAKGIDKKYKIIAKLKLFINFIILRIQSIIAK